MVVDGFPLNINARSVPGTIAESLLRSAMCAAPTISGVAPKAFESSTRTLLPPMLARAIMRTVWLLNALGGGAGRAGAPGTGAAAWGGGAGATRGCCCAETHVATQCGPGACAQAKCVSNTVRNARRRVLISASDLISRKIELPHGRHHGISEMETAGRIAAPAGQTGHGDQIPRPAAGSRPDRAGVSSRLRRGAETTRVDHDIPLQSRGG